MGVEQGGNWHAYDRLPAVRRTRCRCEMRARNARPEVLGPGRRISRGRCAGGAGAATPPSVRAVLSNNIVSGVGPCGAAALGLEPNRLVSSLCPAVPPLPSGAPRASMRLYSM